MDEEGRTKENKPGNEDQEEWKQCMKLETNVWNKNGMEWTDGMDRTDRWIDLTIEIEPVTIEKMKCLSFLKYDPG